MRVEPATTEESPEVLAPEESKREAYATWQPSRERMEHDWNVLRGNLVRARVRLVIIGNAVVLM